MADRSVTESYVHLGGDSGNQTGESFEVVLVAREQIAGTVLDVGEPAKAVVLLCSSNPGDSRPAPGQRPQRRAWRLASFKDRQFEVGGQIIQVEQALVPMAGPGDSVR